MIAIIGAGGHARCVYECLYLQGEKVIGFFDIDQALIGGEVINGLKVLGTPEDIGGYREVEGIAVALGDNRRRMRRYLEFKDKGYRMVNAVHREAYCSPFAKIGEGLFVMGQAMINPGSRIGSCCVINTGATVGHDCLLEDGAQIGPGVNLAGGSVLKEGVFVGIGAKVGPGVTIGAWSVVGAGAVVLDDIPAHSFCCGIPARVREK